jgi:hypothetical protein
VVCCQPENAVVSIPSCECDMTVAVADRAMPTTGEAVDCVLSTRLADLYIVHGILPGQVG